LTESVGHKYPVASLYSVNMGVEREGFRTHSELGQGLALARGGTPRFHIAGQVDRIVPLKQVSVVNVIAQRHKKI
jgi:hypothetical protein